MRRYGCHSRPPLKDTMLVRDGYWQEPSPEFGQWMRRINVKEIKVQTSKDCHHTKEFPKDPACEGCPHQKDRKEGGES